MAEEVQREFTEQQKQLINYFRASVVLKSPDTETDPAYKFTDEDLWNILSSKAPAHNSKYTIETIPANEMDFVLMLSRKEIYWRLATSTAPFYPLSAEGAELKKNVRFDHYLALIQQLESEYRNSVKQFEESIFGALGEVNTYEQVSKNNYFRKSNYDRAIAPSVELKASGITSSSVNLDWTKFNIQSGIFARYDLYVQDTPIVDEYSTQVIQNKKMSVVANTNIHRTKHRVENLEPDKEYYICIVARDANGLFGYSEVKIRTLPVS